MTVYIPSFFNEYTERINLFDKCIKSYLSLGFNIVVYWMNDDSYKIIDDRITYINSNEILNASIARNVLLNIFYDSDEDLAIFSDDDTILKDYINYDFDFDVLSLTNDYSSELRKTYNISSSFLLIKNINKKYGKKYFFDESLTSNQDLDFGINLITNGLQVYRLKEIKIIINRGKSSMFKNDMEKIKMKSKSLKEIINKWGVNKYEWI